MNQERNISIEAPKRTVQCVLSGLCFYSVPDYYQRDYFEGASESEPQKLSSASHDTFPFFGMTISPTTIQALHDRRHMSYEHSRSAISYQTPVRSI